MKLMLVIDKHENCSDCPCNYDYFYCQAFQKRIPNFEKDIIPDWCPLRPLPRKEEMPKRGDDDFNDFCRGYSMGFNDCIDEILGETQ